MKRSRFRRVCGQLFYRLKREMDWHFSRKKFARSFREDPGLPHVIFRHQTPLIRNLPQVDLWLQQNKVKNLGLAVPKLNGLLLKPGEVFSLWRLLGKPTSAKGYLPGFVLESGKVKPGIGGGLCQLSNLIYWMTLHTPLTVIERWRHSYDVFPDCNRTIPFGSGATCSFPSLDLQIANPTAKTFQLCLQLDAGYLKGEWRSEEPGDRKYQVYEMFHEISCGLGGRYVRSNRLHRKVFNRDGLQIGDEFITENHALMMYEPFLTDTLSNPGNKGE